MLWSTMSTFIPFTESSTTRYHVELRQHLTCSFCAAGDFVAPKYKNSAQGLKGQGQICSVYTAYVRNFSPSGRSRISISPKSHKFYFIV